MLRQVNYSLVRFRLILLLSILHGFPANNWRIYCGARSRVSSASTTSNFAKIFLPIFTMLLTPGGSPPVILFLSDSCGAVFPATSPPGPAGVWPASGARFTATRAWFPNLSPSRSDVFLICMLIWWACYSTVIISIIFLPSMIAHPSGWKLFPCQIRPWRHAQRL